ncbi:MAG TPA: DUF21 domain-containing protein, partial [Chitinophagaceae bacterium]|nr:DUF21 domain-containing protein [Chitinophagaceae bacterium]
MQNICFNKHLFSPLIILAAGTPPVTTVFSIILLVLIMFSFIVSGAQVAYFSLTSKDINLLKTKEQPSYKKIVDLLEDPRLLLASLLIGRIFIYIAIITLSSLIIDDAVHFSTSIWWLLLLIKIIIVSALLLLFCEVMPRIVARSNNLRFAEYTGLVVEMVYFVFKR